MVLMAKLDKIIVHFNNPTKADIKLVIKAYELAKVAHVNQTRYSGEPYVSHVIQVATRLAEMGMSPDTVAAALLHDILEDTAVTTEEISDLFSEEILFLVEGVSKLSSVRYYGSDRHNESLRKLFIATSQDIRVLIIKLVDRLHNMQTLQYVPAKKQGRIARETLEIYAAVAHRLGMGRIRKELEDLAFPYVYPDEYQRVCILLEENTNRAEEHLKREQKLLQKKLANSSLIDFQTSYRIKGLYSLFQKLKRKKWDIDNIYDLLAMRVAVESIEDCYRTLGIVHGLWRPLPKRVKDYIAFPKPNGYQSIHTTVATPSKLIFEIQIRTQHMNHEAEYGIASYIKYKQKQAGSKNLSQSWFSYLVPTLFRPFSWREKSLSKLHKVPGATNYHNLGKPRERIPKWIQEIGEMYQESDSANQFVDDLRQDFFNHRIFIFTPNGDVVDLPAGATSIDFAYAIHSDIGNHTASAKINQKLSALNSELKNGDIVEIKTGKNAAPTQKWLASAKTSLARRRIRAALGLTEAKN